MLSDGAMRGDEGPAGDLPKISVVVKTLNEEHNIARCLDAVIRALDEVANPWEIVVADCLSNDRTVQIAQSFPARVVQLVRPSDRGCGSGVQLGYQHSDGDLVLLLDADMELQPGFLPAALKHLGANPTVAGVAGVLREQSYSNEFDRYRTANRVSDRPRCGEPWLNGGGLYRRAAIAGSGSYAGNRNLKAWEEAELGMRLTAAGWRLDRLEETSVLHSGHQIGTWALLRSHWRSRRAMAHGVLLRASIGRPWWRRALRLLAHPVLVIGMWLGALVIGGLSLVSGDPTWLAAFALLVIAVLIGFAIYKRSALHAATSFALWHYHAAALLAGLLTPMHDPTDRLDSKDVGASARR